MIEDGVTYEWYDQGGASSEQDTAVFGTGDSYDAQFKNMHGYQQYFAAEDRLADTTEIDFTEMTRVEGTIYLYE